MISQGKGRVVIRIGQHHLSFSAIDASQDDTPVTYEPYVMKSGVSLPANLREALSDAGLAAAGISKAHVLVDAPVLLIPVEQFEESTMEVMYNQAFPRKELDTVLYNVLSDLNVVAAFAVSKDLRTVLTDHFSSLQIQPVMTPVWRHLHRRSFTGNRSKLYGYHHDQRLEVFTFYQNRFKFCNQFQASRPQDIVYFLLYVWNQLQLNADSDEMHLVGTVFDAVLVATLRRYLGNVYVVNPSAEFNRAPFTRVADLPFDLMAFFARWAKNDG